jgi:hypothetical protein
VPFIDFSSTASAPRHSAVLSGLRFTPAPVSQAVAPTKGKGGRDSPEDQEERGGGRKGGRRGGRSPGQDISKVGKREYWGVHLVQQDHISYRYSYVLTMGAGIGKHSSKLHPMVRTQE